MTAADPFTDYYARRAREYDRIYAKPERLADLAALRDQVAAFAQDRRVLEVACGTGWWTQFMAPVAAAITALDINPEVLQIATLRPHLSSVRWLCRDLYSGEPLSESFNAGFAAFWWSHVPRKRLPEFLTTFHRHLDPGSPVMLIDNRYVPGSSTPVSRTDEEGNTYQLRRLDSGSEHEVLKNFPEPADVGTVLAPFATDAEVKLLPYFWSVTYRVAECGSHVHVGRSKP
ncbi:MAG TPA: methyltransferase domain-containing protein [Verrucomicrobiota bacterium]|nr:class I SAM-dependent methyltransferase [Verrucomicrobiales bacterium]HRI12686.1 methyltransferase domain-containing protein [Verrucomicrobiota bacterium]